MKRILIADSSKASLVMTSEVFKDHYPGIQVMVARNSADVIALAKSTENIDAFIVDFDLPDTNGAQTALILKKISKTPILITAFDNKEVIHTIETLLVKYEDCRSWLKKPVNPEVVIAVTQRYCDGKVRTQKRIQCHLPAKISTAKSNVVPAKTAKSKTTQTKTKEIKPVCFHGIIEDCSLNGVKLKPIKQAGDGLTEWSNLLEDIEQIASGSPVAIIIPTSDDIEFGKASDFVKTPKSAKKMKEEKSQELNGKIAWVSAESGEWRMGIEFDDQAQSKRLFEAVVSLQSRQHKPTQNQSIMKTARSA